MARLKTKLAKVPINVWEDARTTALKFGHKSATDGFDIMRKLRNGEWELKRVKKKGRNKDQMYLIMNK